MTRTTGLSPNAMRSGAHRSGRRLNQDIAAPSAGIPSALARLGYDHIGDLDHHDGRLFAPLENNAEPKLAARLGVFRASDLSFVGSAEIEKTSMPWCAVDPVSGLLHTSTFNPRSIHRYALDLTGGSLSLVRVASIPLSDQNGAPLKLYHVQGGAFTGDGRWLFLATDHEDGSGAAKGFSIFDAASGRRVAHRSVSYDPISFGGEIEGIDVWGLKDPADGRSNALLHLLVLNNDTFDSDNIVIKNWRVIFDEAASLPPAPDPQPVCTALRERYDNLGELLANASDTAEASATRSAMAQVLAEMKRRGCPLP